MRFIQLILVTASLILQASSLAYGSEVEKIIKQVEDNLNGKTAFMKFTMKVTTRRHERTIKMDSYSIGKEKSFIKITYPNKDKGITFLKVDKTMWQYVPRIEKTIKIPASMMMQSWMGSDFTNDDLVRESSISEDYQVSLLDSSDEAWQLKLLAKEDAPVVWGKIIMSVSKKYHLPTKAQYFDEDDILIRELNYTSIKPYGERFYPSHWLMMPKTEEKTGHKTEFIVDEAEFDQEISSSYFSKRALKRFSK